MLLAFVSLDFKDADERIARMGDGANGAIYQILWDWALEGDINYFTKEQAIDSVLSSPFVDLTRSEVGQSILDLLKAGLLRMV